MKDSFYFSHDFNAQNDEKIIDLRMQFGWEGYGIYWAIIEHLAQARDYKLSIKSITRLAFVINIDITKFNSVITLLFDVKLLVKNEEFFWSESLSKRMQFRAEKSTKLKQSKSEAGKKGMEKRWGTSQTQTTNNVDTINDLADTSNQESLQNDNTVITQLYQSNNTVITADNQGKESKGKESKISKEKSIKKEITYDFVSNDFLVFYEFLEFRKKQHNFTYKNEKYVQEAYNELLNLSNNNPETAKAIVKQSIVNGWKGLFELKKGFQNGNNGTVSSNGKQLSDYEKRRQLTVSEVETNRADTIARLKNGDLGATFGTGN